MSRTDKDKPHLVRVAEHQPWAEHDHSRGICDLPDSPLESSYRDWCRWSDWNLIYSSCCRGCGCKMCTGYWVRRAENRRDRHQARALLRSLAQGGEEPNRRAPARKDTGLWCRGKVGTRHITIIRFSKWASWSARTGGDCYEAPADSWRNGWQCFHELGCVECGKILYPFLDPADCPLNPKNVRSS